MRTLVDKTPCWDPKLHTLKWRRVLVKHFKEEAPFQEAILAAFQRSRWASCILLTQAVLSKLNSKSRLHDAVKNLNRSVKPHLRFGLEGNGTRMRWEPYSALHQRYTRKLLDK